MVSRLVRTQLQRQHTRHGSARSGEWGIARGTRWLIYVVPGGLPVGSSVSSMRSHAPSYHFQGIGFRVARYLPPELSGDKGFADAK